MDQNWTQITEKERKAPPGKFRVVAVGTQFPSDPVYLVSDHDDKQEAMRVAEELLKTRFDDFFGYQVHDEHSKGLLSDE